MNLAFDLEQTGILVQSPAAMSVSQTSLVDLGSNADVRAHQKDIKNLDLEYADVNITDIRSGTTATHLSLSVSLRKGVSDPPENDVLVGNIPSFPVVNNATTRIPGNAALDSFLLDRLHDGGKFYLVVSGTTDGKTDLVMAVNLHASMAYDTGLF